MIDNKFLEIVRDWKGRYEINYDRYFIKVRDIKGVRQAIGKFIHIKGIFDESPLYKGFDDFEREVSVIEGYRTELKGFQDAGCMAMGWGDEEAAIMDKLLRRLGKELIKERQLEEKLLKRHRKE